MARRIDNVDLDLFAAVAHIANRGVLGEDRDALFPLQVHRIHDPLGHRFIGSKGAGLP